MSDLTKLDIDKVRGAVEYGIRKFAEPIWEQIDPVVDVRFVKKHPDADGMFRLTGRLAKRPFKQEEIEDEVITVCAYMATLPFKLIGYALQHKYDPELQKPNDVLALDGRPVVDGKPRFGVKPGMIVDSEVGALALDEAFREARTRIWDAAANRNIDATRIKQFSIWYPTSLSQLTLGALDPELPARIAGTRVKRVECPWLGDGAVYVIAHSPKRQHKPFAWMRPSGLTIHGAEGRYLFDQVCGLSVRDTWSIVKIEVPS